MVITLNMYRHFAGLMIGFNFYQLVSVGSLIIIHVYLRWLQLKRKEHKTFGNEPGNH